jgi:hypothetical protein
MIFDRRSVLINQRYHQKSARAACPESRRRFRNC